MGVRRVTLRHVRIPFKILRPLRKKPGRRITVSIYVKYACPHARIKIDKFILMLVK